MSANTVIFGKNSEQRIVAVYVESDTVHVWMRAEDGTLHHRTEPCYPYFWLDSDAAARAVKTRFQLVRWVRLQGEGVYRHLLVFEHLDDAARAAQMVQQMGGRVMVARREDMETKAGRLRLMMRRVAERYRPVRDHLARRDLRRRLYLVLLRANVSATEIADQWLDYIEGVIQEVSEENHDAP